MTSQKGLRYDGSIDKYPITEGEIYSLGNGSKITIADITLGLPEFSKNADCVFIDPAGSKGVLKAYYTKAEKQCPVDNFDEFVAHIKRCIEQINPDRLFVECFYRNKKQLVPMVESLFPHVKIYENTYYHKPDCKCWIIQGTKQAEEYGGFQDDYSQVDEENFEAPSNEEAGESEETSSDEEEEDPAKDLFVLKEREDGSHYMKVVCPYCGNMETIEIED